MSNDGKVGCWLIIQAGLDEGRDLWEGAVVAVPRVGDELYGPKPDDQGPWRVARVFWNVPIADGYSRVAGSGAPPGYWQFVTAIVERTS